ncbi:MAG: diheme cytochrome c [Deltaproteobacteria bacterium]|nr:diheme cytochrome c [Deltaproteobacteria bacterium]
MKIDKKSLIMAAILSVAALSLSVPWVSHAEEERHEAVKRRSGDHEEEGERHDIIRAQQNKDKNRAPFPESALYKQECSSCHFLYHPGLLPLRSWEAVIQNSDKHFGENLSLEDKIKDDLLSYFYEHSAEKTDSKWARRILSWSAPSVPARITEQPFIIREHRKIQKSVFKRPSINSFSNCGACHPKGAEGDFDEDSVEIPAK